MTGAAMGDVLKDIAKKFDLQVGSPSVIVESVSRLSTGNLAIDFVTGGGLPVGRSIELYGVESSGKTTTGLQAAAQLQSRLIAEASTEHILYLDFEHSFDPDYAQALGIDHEHPTFLLAQPHSMEQGAEAALKLIDTGLIRLSIWDSVAAMAPLSRLEGDFDQRTAAMNKARLMAGLMLQMTPLLHKHRCTAVYINHLMESIDMNSRNNLPPKVTTPGGRALKYYASLRLEYRQIGNTKTKSLDGLTGELANRAVASVIRVKCVKSKVSTPMREADVCVRYGRGFDNAWSALQVLLAHGVIGKGGVGWHRFNPPLQHPDMDSPGRSGPSIQTEAAVLAFADEHPDWAAILVGEAVALLDQFGDKAVATTDAVVDDPLAVVEEDDPLAELLDDDQA
jgi:recombination protein RecA